MGCEMPPAYNAGMKDGFEAMARRLERKKAELELGIERIHGRLTEINSLLDYVSVRAGRKPPCA